MYCSYEYYLRSGILVAFGQSHVRRIAGLRGQDISRYNNLLHRIRNCSHGLCTYQRDKGTCF
ncbi:hypothetical protein BGZ60DRAFT_421736 [Tricladium varicosporioides]|nr:hypothetical protein BGZ60DRAFT_421736 [Hymenoscyphus varicosporioides]